MSATPDSGANGAPQNPPGAGPLAGVKVLELGTLIAGPFAARFLGEFGADVIKIEDPKGGDPLRKWRKLYPEVGGTSLWWAVQARNKKSVTINLKAEEGKEIVRRLAREADIVVENFRPGLLEKLGLGYDVLSAENPGLVMVRLSGYGPECVKTHFWSATILHPIAGDERDEAVRSRRQSYSELSPPRST